MAELLFAVATTKWMCGYYRISCFAALFGYSADEKNANTIFEFIKAPVTGIFKFMNYLPKLAAIIVIVTISSLVLRGLRFLKKKSERGH